MHPSSPGSLGFDLDPSDLAWVQASDVFGSAFEGSFDVLFRWSSDLIQLFVRQGH